MIERVDLEQTKLNASNIKLASYQSVLRDEPKIEEEKKTEKSEKSPVDVLFKSTPNFVRSLTDLSFKILINADKKGTLIDGLQEINSHLPAACYVPFLQLR